MEHVIWSSRKYWIRKAKGIGALSRTIPEVEANIVERMMKISF